MDKSVTGFEIGGPYKSRLSREDQEASFLAHIVPEEKNTIIMPLDPSDSSEYAIQFYLKYIHRPSDKVYACYVTDALSDIKQAEKEELGKKAPSKLCLCCPCLSFDKIIVDVGPSPGVLAELEKAEQIRRHKVKNIVRHYLTANKVDFEFRILRGDEPSDTIIDFRREIGATMILMGSRGEGAVKRQIFGSVSDKVMHHALVPVLIVKKPEGAMQAYHHSDNTFIP